MSQTLQSTYVGVFDLFRIGIGPSSSHTVGPIRAGDLFLSQADQTLGLSQIVRVRVDLYGSLALTGLGHMTDTAVLLGLSGHQPETIDPDLVTQQIHSIRTAKKLMLAGQHQIDFNEKTDLIFNRRTFLKGHPNGMKYQAFTSQSGEEPALEAVYYSIGGGFVIREGEQPADTVDATPVPYPFCSGKELLELTEHHHCSISQLVWMNERTRRTDAEIRTGLQSLWETMKACVKRGCSTTGILPGGLNIERRAPRLYTILKERAEASLRDPMAILDWVDLYAIAVNEENAAGGKVVTAPTNGAAGIIPSVLHYFDRFCPESSPEKIEQFLLTAAAIGSLYKQNASISGAEVGCQGEVGVACSMAAAGLTEVLGGTPEQVEEAAEIGMEHNLGLTCDPIKGLVQVPCIERNAMGAVKAINASRLALRGTGKHFVSLDRVIRVMKRTGADMSSRYKETSRGGLAVNISEC